MSICASVRQIGKLQLCSLVYHRRVRSLPPPCLAASSTPHHVNPPPLPPSQARSPPNLIACTLPQLQCILFCAHGCDVGVSSRGSSYACERLVAASSVAILQGSKQKHIVFVSSVPSEPNRARWGVNFATLTSRYTIKCARASIRTACKRSRLSYRQAALPRRNSRRKQVSMSRILKHHGLLLLISSRQGNLRELPWRRSCTSTPWYVCGIR